MKWDKIPKDPEMNGKTIFEVVDTACEKHTLTGEKPTNLRDGFEQAFFDNEEEAIENRHDREDIIKTLKAEAMQKIEAGGEE